jgi:hypothetical protein
MATYTYDGPAAGTPTRTGPYRFKLPLAAGGFQMIQVAAVGDIVTVTDAKAMAFVAQLKDISGTTLFTKNP